MKLFEEILEFLKDNSVELKDKRVLLSFSGGPDSTLLFYFLLYCQKKFNIYFECFYLNHNEREDVLKEENFVKKICKDNNIRLNYRSEKVLDLKETKKLGFERAAREVRKKYLFDILKKKKFDYIFTGHNLTDAVETFFINLQRNTGIRGASSIDPVENVFVRPLLFLKKNDILNMLKKEGIEYIEDPTNLNKNILRNRIRHDLIPVLENSLKDGIYHFKVFFNNLKEFENGFEQLLFEYLKIFQYENGSLVIDISKVLVYNKKLRKILIYIALSKFFYVNRNIIDEVEKIIASSKKNIEKKIGDFYLEKKYNIILVYKSKEEKEDLKDFCEIKLNRKVYFNGFEVSMKKVKSENVRFDKNRFYFTLDCGKRFFLKRYERGYRMTLFNCDYEKKISKIFLDLKVEKSLRERLPVIINEKNEVLVLGDLKRSNLYVVDLQKEKECIQFYVKRIC
ncbi:MAG: tRNA lysidine(34) synthetase TilS [candidate division WOR-3 bacterium]